MSILIVLTISMFFEPLATDSKNFLPLRSVTNRQHDQVIDIPCVWMGSLLNDSPKQSFVFLDGVSASPGSVSCHSLYKREAPTLDSASLFIQQLVIPHCRIPDRTNELSNACRAC